MIQFDNAVERFNKIIITELSEQNVICWIAGGAVRDYFMGKFTKTDYDVFFPNLESYEKAKKYLIDNGAILAFENDNGCKVHYINKTFDLVKKFFNNAAATIEAFDFTVSMFAVDSKNVYHGETSFIDLSKRQLMINKITYPASTMSRAFRYYNKGFAMCKGEMRKMVEAIQAMPKVNTETTTENTENEPPSGDDDNFFIGID